MSKTPIERLQQQEFIVMDRILKSREICAALMFNEQDFLGRADELPENRDFMSFMYVYPHDFIPSRVIASSATDSGVSGSDIETIRSYITIVFGDYRPAGGVHFKASSLTINIFTHQDIEQIIGPTMTRSRYVAFKIDELFNQKHGLGIGKTNFMAMNPVRINEFYQGYTMVYRIDDFQ